jgi:hypothetical protein
MNAILLDLDDLDINSLERSDAVQARAQIEQEVLPSIARLEKAINVLERAADKIGRVVEIEEHPMATISITEDLATSVRLHALGWKSIFHSEVLARGLAPEDLLATIKQRSRWAQGTLQVLVKDSPLTKSGLSFMQRLQYLTTMFSYFYGFAALVYLLAPVIPLFTDIAPVRAYSMGFFLRLLPYLVLNQLMFIYATRGLSTLRGQQYQLALFPVWIGALLKVFLKADLKFEVTPKQRQKGIFLHLIKPQLAIILINTVAIAYGFFRIHSGLSLDPTSILVNIFWAAYNTWMLSSIVRGALWQPVRSAASSTQSIANIPEIPREIIGGKNHGSIDRGKHSESHSHLTIGRDAQRAHSSFIEAAN